MTIQIDTLTQLCLEKPFSVEKIQRYISENRLSSEAVTQAAIAICEKARFAYDDFLSINQRHPLPQELITYNWEALFDVLIANGLDVNFVSCDNDNILLSLCYLYGENLKARIVFLPHCAHRQYSSQRNQE